MPSKKPAPSSKRSPKAKKQLTNVIAYGPTNTVQSPKERINKWMSSPLVSSTTPTESRVDQLQENMNWRIFRIMAEFVEGFDFLMKYKKTVSIFGSTRASFANPSYQQAKKLGYLLGKEGFAVITGGGPGIMEAANWGAYESGASSVGLNIELPEMERSNQYIKESRAFHHFFTRKVMLSAAAQAYIFFPGGFGTFDELFEIVTLIQTGKMDKRVPAILVGKQFWQPMIDWITHYAWDENLYLDRHELDLLQLVDTAEEAYDIVMAAVCSEEENPES